MSLPKASYWTEIFQISEWLIKILIKVFLHHLLFQNRNFPNELNRKLYSLLGTAFTATENWAWPSNIWSLPTTTRVIMKKNIDFPGSKNSSNLDTLRLTAPSAFFVKNVILRKCIKFRWIQVTRKIFHYKGKALNFFICVWWTCQTTTVWIATGWIATDCNKKNLSLKV